MSESSLPKLNPKNGGKRSNSKLKQSPPNSDKQNVLSSIKKEINLLYPHLQSVEKEIDTYQHQIPLNINKVIIQMRSEIEKISEENEINMIQNEETEKSKLQIEIDKLESVLQKELNSVLNTSKKNLELKVEKLTKPSIKEETNVLTETQKDNEYDSIIEDIEQSIKSQQLRTQKRLEAIEVNLQKFNERALSPIEDDKECKTINDALDDNRKAIGTIKYNLRELKDRLKTQIESNNSKSLAIARNPRASKIAVASQLHDSIKIDDIDEPLEELHNKISTKQTEFSERVSDLKQRTRTCQERVQRADIAAIKLVAATASLESKITEMSNLCKKLEVEMNGLEFESSDDKNPNLIQDLIQKVNEDHEKLKTEIESLKQRAEKCQEKIRSNDPKE